jgi:hypothetical protein
VYLVRYSTLNRFVVAMVAILALFHIAGCKKAAVNPFPGSGEIAGWQKNGDVRVFDAKNLWEYIDGDAEQYVKAGVVSTSTADYNYQARLEAVIDVHTMGDAEGARKIMDGARAGDARPVQLGDGGLEYSQSITFRKGVYLVRIVAYQSYGDGPQALLALAHGVEAKL